MKELREKANFSIWCDFIERDFLENEFKELLKREIINGVTSNPSIFKNAILTSSAYKKDLELLKGREPKEIYEELAIKDIKRAAILLKEFYKKGDDGFVSIEIDPNFCNNAEESINEAKRLYKKINEPNVMIKVPATEAGYQVIEELISLGISVNTTLIFSPKQAEESLKAYKRGYQKLNRNKAIPKGVISVFVSRFDRKLDKELEKNGLKNGLLGILNATKIYHQIEAFGLKEVKTLFASTGVKGDEYPEDYYITNLLYKNSVNTAPLKTIKAFEKNQKKEIISPKSSEEIEEFFYKIKKSGTDIERVYQELIEEGLSAFIEAFKEIIDELKG